MTTTKNEVIENETAVTETAPVVKKPRVKKEKVKKPPKQPKAPPVILTFPKAHRLTDIADFSGATGGKIAAAFATLWQIDGNPGIWSHLLTVKTVVASNPEKLAATLTENETTLKIRGAADADLANPMIATMAVKGDGCAVFKRLESVEAAIAACVEACG